MILDKMTQQEYLQWLFETIKKYNGITEQQILSSTRKKEVAEARHVLVYMMRLKTDIGLQDLCLLTGRTNHTTAMHSQKVVKDALDTNYRPIVNLVEYLNDPKVQVVSNIKKQVAEDIWNEIKTIFAKYDIPYGNQTSEEIRNEVQPTKAHTGASYQVSHR